MIELVLPDPSVVVLVAAAGAGKSTFAARHFGPAEILSSDAYRAIVSGDEANQRATPTAFRLLHRTLERRLADHRLTVIDATNLERPARREILLRAAAAGVPAIAIVLDLPPAVILARNAGRSSRAVGESVVLRHLARLRASLDRPAPPFDGEGFERVILLRDPAEVDSIAVLRQPVGTA
ncbi:MAG: AAA family ATPase [Chloroflexi bacterium]|nr:AAA family ATPase [Chloroflexota bacterium]